MKQMGESEGNAVELSYNVKLRQLGPKQLERWQRKKNIRYSFHKKNIQTWIGKTRAKIFIFVLSKIN